MVKKPIVLFVLSMLAMIFGFQNCESVNGDIVSDVATEERATDDNHIINIYDPDGYNAGLVTSRNDEVVHYSAEGGSECDGDFARIEVEPEQAYLVQWQCEDIEPEPIEIVANRSGSLTFDGIEFFEVSEDR